MIYVVFWYLLVVELQGTNQDEERRGAPNPFWEKLGKIRKLRSGQASRRSILVTSTKPATLLVGYAQDVQP